MTDTTNLNALTQSALAALSPALFIVPTSSQISPTTASPNHPTLGTLTKPAL
ncbi:hypothetical protein ACNI65_07385 [Roseateles sp. So40a]|uniref:hypothetical protein n=1 Tax=Roseateles sp. So40a TaxID=3400226 RepID=UPI003A8C73D3